MNKKRILTTAGITAIFVAVILVVTVLIRNGGKRVEVSGDSDFVVEATTDRYTSGEFTTGYATGDNGTDEIMESTEGVTEAQTGVSNTETVSESVTIPEIATVENTADRETETASSVETPEITESYTDGTEKESTSEQSTANQESTDETTVNSSSSPDNTEEYTTETESETNPENSTEQHNYAEFSFIKYKTEDMPANFDWSKYLERQGYIPVKNVSELNTYATGLINYLPDKKNIKYIISPKGELDSICMDEGVSDVFLYEKLGLDYETYLSKGVAVFKFKKIQDIENDVTNKTVYALYYYSYLDGLQMKEVDDKIAEIVSGFTGNDFDRIKAAHDKLMSDVSYDNSTNPNLVSHTAYGALINGECVCEGYAKAYKLMLDAMNIKCNYVTSSVHAWNEVEYEGRWYMVDVTNDATNKGYCYFMLGEDVLLSDKDIHIDGFILDEEGRGQISQYGYKDGKNSSTVRLNETTYNYDNRIRISENPQ